MILIAATAAMPASPGKPPAQEMPGLSSANQTLGVDGSEKFCVHVFGKNTKIEILLFLGLCMIVVIYYFYLMSLSQTWLGVGRDL